MKIFGPTALMPVPPDSFVQLDVRRGTGRRSMDRFVARLDAAGVPCGPVNNVQEVFEDPHVKAQGIAVTVPHASLGETTVTAPPWHFGGQRPPVRRAPPTLGQHTDEVLTELNLAETEKETP